MICMTVVIHEFTIKSFSWDAIFSNRVQCKRDKGKLKLGCSGRVRNEKKKRRKKKFLVKKKRTVLVLKNNGRIACIEEVFEVYSCKVYDNRENYHEDLRL
jgi:hypothetical protein